MIEPKFEIPENTGSVILSFDFEIGWGDISNPRWRQREKAGVYKRLRKVLPVILNEMDELEISGTWATVGAMFDNPNARNFSHLPTDVQQQIEISLGEAEPESFDGRDLFEAVIERHCRHHIASHTYSHVPFTLDGVSGEMVRQDLAAFNATLNGFGLATDRFVFPENREKFSDIVSSCGFEKARVAAPEFSKTRMINLAATAILAPPCVSETRENCGLIRHTGSLLFHDAGKSWRRKLLKHRIGSGLNEAMRKKKCLHVWSHPFNFAESEDLLNAFLNTLRKIARARDSGKIEIVLM